MPLEGAGILRFQFEMPKLPKVRFNGLSLIGPIMDVKELKKPYGCMRLGHLGFAAQVRWAKNMAMILKWLKAEKGRGDFGFVSEKVLTISEWCPK